MGDLDHHPDEYLSVVKLSILTAHATDRVALQAKCNELRLPAAGAERANPVSFAIGNSWNDTLRADKQRYLEYTTRSQT